MSASTSEKESAAAAEEGQVGGIRARESVEGLSREVIFDILSNHRRRYVLRYLNEQGEESNLRTLSEQIAAWENDIPPSQVSSKQRMRAYTALRQSHLPKMDRQGVIEFDSQSGTVRLTEAASALEEYLESSDSSARSWPHYYLGLGILGLIISVGCFFDVYPLGFVPDVVAGLVISVGVVTFGMLQTMESARSDETLPGEERL